MYAVARAFLIVAMLGAYYMLAVILVIGWPGSVVVAVVVFGFKAARERRQLTTLGSARWADESNLRNARMMDAQSGLVLGRLPDDLRRSRSSLRILLDREITNEQACRIIWVEMLSHA